MIFNQNPLFVNQGSGDLRLQLCSPAINVGDNTGVSGTDLDNNARIALATVDMGAYEFQANTSTIIPVITAGTHPLVCNGTNGAIVLSGLTANLTYSVSYKKDMMAVAAADFTANASGIITLSNLTKGSYTDIKLTYGRCSSTPASVTLLDPIAPAIMLMVNGQTAAEGSTLTICDTDTNFNNPLQFNITTTCFSGVIRWRVQVEAADWSSWSSNIPTRQPSDNTLYRYQAACDDNCSATYTNPIEVKINYRASTPQNVSLTADGITVNAGQSATVCNSDGNTIAFNATCAEGEILLYSVDGSEYSTTVPSQIVDGNFHNYRVRCRKANGTPSCVETESAVMSLKITTSGPAPTVSITPLSSCGTPTAFSGSSNCGALTTIWYNSDTKTALPTLPATTPNTTTSFYARCQTEAGCLSEMSNTVTFTVISVNTAPLITASQDIVCTGTQVTVSAKCPAGSTAFWNTGVNNNSFQVAFNNVSQHTYWAKCITPNGCQSPESIHKTVTWKAFELTFINIGQSQSAIKPANDRNLWASQFITPDAGPAIDHSNEANPTIYYSENVNKTAPRFWTIQVEACALGTNGSVTYDMLATPEVGAVRSYNTHENNAPYLMYANREGFTELYAQNHPAYGFYQDNGSGGNVYDAGLPKGLYKLSVRYWDQKGQGSIYPSTRQPQGNVLAYQEYWFRIQSQNGIGTGSTRVAATADNGQRITDNGAFAQVMPNPVANIMHLTVSEAKGQTVNASLVDASGRTLIQRSFVPESHQHQEEFEVNNLTGGMYFLRVNTAGKQATLKVLKVQ